MSGANSAHTEFQKRIRSADRAALLRVSGAVILAVVFATILISRSGGPSIKSAEPGLMPYLQFFQQPSSEPIPSELNDGQLKACLQYLRKAVAEDGEKGFYDILRQSELENVLVNLKAKGSSADYILAAGAVKLLHRVSDFKWVGTVTGTPLYHTDEDKRIVEKIYLIIKEWVAGYTSHGYWGEAKDVELYMLAMHAKSWERRAQAMEIEAPTETFNNDIRKSPEYGQVAEVLPKWDSISKQEFVNGEYYQGLLKYYGAQCQ